MIYTINKTAVILLGRDGNLTPELVERVVIEHLIDIRPLDAQRIVPGLQPTTIEE